MVCGIPIHMNGVRVITTWYKWCAVSQFIAYCILIWIFRIFNYCLLPMTFCCRDFKWLVYLLPIAFYWMVCGISIDMNLWYIQLSPIAFCCYIASSASCFKCRFSLLIVLMVTLEWCHGLCLNSLMVFFWKLYRKIVGVLMRNSIRG